MKDITIALEVYGETTAEQVEHIIEDALNENYVDCTFSASESFALSSGDVDQIKIRYANAKAMALKHRNEKNSDYWYEYGKAIALEGMLRLLGFTEYTDVALGKLE